MPIVRNLNNDKLAQASGLLRIIEIVAARISFDAALVLETGLSIVVSGQIKSPIADDEAFYYY